MANRYRKKPVTIEAMRFYGSTESLYRAYKWVAEDTVRPTTIFTDERTGELIIHTLEGDMRCVYGDWIIRGVNGEFYPCKNEIFEKTYELVEEQDSLPEMVESMNAMSEKPMSQYDEMVTAINRIENRKKRGKSDG